MLLSIFDHPAWLWLCVCVAAVAGLIFPPRVAAGIVVVLTLSALILGLLRLDWVQAIPLALLVRGLGLDMIGLVVLMGAMRQLHRQRHVHAQLAVSEERLRVARDMHDLLGQTLSLITLKSALVERLITTDPERAAQEIHDVQQAARTTLREVRSTISGYRQLSVRGELDAARQLFEAVEIHAEIGAPTNPLPPTLDNALAWMIREGVTNVLRHSQATQCSIILMQTDQTVSLEMTNDGCQERIGVHHQGHGLAGVRERVDALSGRMEAGFITKRGDSTYRLRVECPLAAQRDEDMA
jgi:two-component system sensor histidine kinase DesK